MARRYALEERLIDFAAQICRLLERFPTTPVANYAEAQAAESRQDFIHKLKVCLKELRETQVWLKFALKMQLCRETPEVTWRECDELVAIFVASVRTARGKVKMSNVE